MPYSVALPQLLRPSSGDVEAGGHFPTCESSPELVRERLLVRLQRLNENEGKKSHRSRLHADFPHLQRLMSSSLVCFVLGFGNSR